MSRTPASLDGHGRVVRADDVAAVEPHDKLLAPSRSTGCYGPPLNPLATLDRIAVALERLADHVAPLPADIVGSGYVAQRLGCTTVWVAEMARRGDLPKGCIVPGTGNGKLWRFYRQKIDQWLATR
jgi:hypothetical protein